MNRWAGVLATITLLLIGIPLQGPARAQDAAQCADSNTRDAVRIQVLETQNHDLTQKLGELYVQLAKAQQEAAKLKEAAKPKAEEPKK